MDGSQGKEGEIHVIDCTKLGAGAVPKEGMGFLGGDPRRFNVGLSRAMCGRVVICHEDFADGSYSKGPWPAFVAEAKQNKWILSDVLYHGAWPTPELATKFGQVKTDFLRRSGARQGAAKVAPVARVAAAPTAGVLAKSGERYDVDAFVNSTTASEAEARSYLLAARATGGSTLQVAVLRWFEDNPSGGEDDEVEEIVRDGAEMHV